MTAVPYWASDDGDVTLFVGDCLDVLRTLPADSVDAIVTDPPAGVAFMSRTWDTYGSRARFVEWLTERLTGALRVLKPGGHALVWSLPRTSGWTQWAVEDAGFEVRDCVLHVFGSGFPKGLDVSKAIDRALGAERAQRNGQGSKTGVIDFGMKNRCPDCGKPYFSGSPCTCPRADDVPATEEAARWAGWNVALKPGQEIWWLARKPLGAGSVAANVLRWGTGALNIAACKVGTTDDLNGGTYRNSSSHPSAVSAWNAADDGSLGNGIGEFHQPAGRWPANLVFTHSASDDPSGECVESCPVGELDRQSGATVSRSGGRTTKALGLMNDDAWQPGSLPRTGHDDTGGASRFYPVFKYQAKAPASERPRLEDGTAHETVKPLGFISWAVRLVTPPGGTVLDMFAGSGPVAEACIIEGFRAVLIEQNVKSAELIRKRLAKPIQPVMFGLEGA